MRVAKQPQPAISTAPPGHKRKEPLSSSSSENVSKRPATSQHPSQPYRSHGGAAERAGDTDHRDPRRREADAHAGVQQVDDRGDVVLPLVGRVAAGSRP